jgi:hypothetical protein
MITNQPQQFESGIDGAAPVQWFGPDAPDGDRGPWATAPVGSLYCKKSATQTTTWYTKEKNDNTDGFDRLVSGGALVLKDGAYHFTDRFIAHFKAFIKK